MNVSKIMKEKLCETQIGTPYYLAPEIWNRKQYSVKCDIFSLGCVIYELMCFKRPFQAASTKDLYRKVMTKEILDLPSCYSKELIFFVQSCLNKNAMERPSAKEILTHPEFNQKIQSYKLGELRFSLPFNENFLLNTIEIPDDLTQLNKILPNFKRTHSVDKIGLIEETTKRFRKLKKQTTCKGSLLNNIKSFKEEKKRKFNSTKKNSKQKIPPYIGGFRLKPKLKNIKIKKMVGKSKMMNSNKSFENLFNLNSVDKLHTQK